MWSWDITSLATTVRGAFFYLYLILDIYRRKIVGWEVYAQESAEHAARVFERAHLREGVGAADLVLHADNGSPMKGATMLATLQRLGVVPSFSRPSVSNDNPFSEAAFATLKGTPAALRFVTPDQRHRGEDAELLARRHALYQECRAQRPERWSGPTRNWRPVGPVTLNPGKPSRPQAPGDAPPP